MPAITHAHPRGKAFPGEAMALPAELLDQLAAEAKARRRKPEALLREWLEDLADARAVARAEKASKGKPNIPLEQIKVELGL